MWDIIGHNSIGAEIFLQCKTGKAEYADKIIPIIHNFSHVLFPLCNEIYDSVLKQAPELAHQLVDVGISNFQFTQDVGHDLAMIAANHGIDVPDSVGEYLPYAKDIVLGIKLLVDIAVTERDFKHIKLDERRRIHALKALVLFSRFGVSIVCTKLGFKLGASIDVGTWGTSMGLGSAVGAIGGALFSAWLNHQLRPHYMEIAMKLCVLSEDNMFYLRNKLAIDKVSQSLFDRQKEISIAFDPVTRRLTRFPLSPCH